MTREEILSRFQGVRQDGPSSWMCLCPAHADRNGSLHVTETPDGRMLLKCFAECRTEDVLRAAGLEFSDLPSNGVQHSSRRYGLHLREYAEAKRLPLDALESYGLRDGVHTAKNGKQYPCVRIAYYTADGKFTRDRKRMCMHGDENGPSRFIWDGQGAPMQLYGLWRQPSDRGFSFLVEGESDCHALWFNGYPALGMPGVGNYKADRDDPVVLQYGSPETPRIYVSMEPDEGGFNLFRRLTGEDGRSASAAVGQMLFFTIPGYKDPSELWSACADRHPGDTEAAQRDFRTAMGACIQNARRWQEFPRPAAWTAFAMRAEKRLAERQARSAAPQAAQGDGNPAPAGHGGAREGAGRKQADYAAAAREFFSRKTFGKSPSLVYWRHGWWEFDGHCYKYKDDADMEGECMAFLQDYGVQEGYRLQPTTNAVRNILLNLRAAGLCHLPQSLKAPAWIHDQGDASGWLPMENCIIDLEAAARVHLEAEERGVPVSPETAAANCRKVTADMLSINAMPYIYEPSDECPLFMRWLEQAQPDPGNREAVQMLMGLSLVPDTSYNVCFFLSGEAGTGKSTFLNILKRFVGEGNVCAVPLLKFSERFQTWPLAENLINVVGEMVTDDPQGRLRYIEGDFKDSCSGGDVNCERKGQDVCTAPCTARHVFACNALPKFFDKSEGIWDRLRIIPFRQRFRGTSFQIPNIENTFLPQELPGIFNFALAGLGKLRRLQTFPETEDMLDAKAVHRNTCDPLSEYLRYNYLPKEGSELSVDAAYEDFRRYSDKNGLKLRGTPSFIEAVCREFGRAGVRMAWKEKEFGSGSTRVFLNLQTISPLNQ